MSKYWYHRLQASVPEPWNLIRIRMRIRTKSSVTFRMQKKSFFLFIFFIVLKVVGNEKQWGSGRRQMLGNGLGPWRSRFIYNLNTQFFNKNHISFSALSSKLKSDYFDNKGCSANNKAMTHRSYLRKWRCGPNSQRESWTCGFFSCTGRVSFYVPNIRCAN